MYFTQPEANAMISGLRKPNPVHRKPNSLPARKRMTLALGMLCKEALVIAADTQITWSDGRTEHGIKVHLVICNSGSYALTCACVDSDAANTLISAIQRDLRLIDPKSLIGMESVITDSMKAGMRVLAQGKIDLISNWLWGHLLIVILPSKTTNLDCISVNPRIL